MIALPLEDHPDYLRFLSEGDRVFSEEEIKRLLSAMRLPPLGAVELANALAALVRKPVGIDTVQAIPFSMEGMPEFKVAVQRLFEAV